MQSIASKADIPEKTTISYVLPILAWEPGIQLYKLNMYVMLPSHEDITSTCVVTVNVDSNWGVFSLSSYVLWFFHIAPHAQCQYNSEILAGV